MAPSTIKRADFAHWNNSLVAKTYDWLGDTYSWGRIPKCKVAAFDHVIPGDKCTTVLIAGVGCGQDAIAAAKRRALVTAVDTSKAMIKTAKENAAKKLHDDPKAFANINFVVQDLLKMDPKHTSFDVVVANFFLNTFSGDIFQAIVTKLCSLVKPGGKLVLGDFCVPRGSFLSKTFCVLHTYTGLGFYAIMVRSAMQVFHMPHKLPEVMDKQGFKVDDIQYFKIMGAKCYWTIIFSHM